MTLPIVNTGRVRLGGLLWPADVTLDTAGAIAELTCGASMGNAPRDLSDYDMHTEVSVVQRIATGGATMPAELWKSRGEALSLGNLTVEMAVCLASLTVPNVLTTGTSDIPGFLFFGVSGGVVVWRHVPGDDLLSPTIDSGTVWNNELAVTNDDLHVVDLPTDGPWLVVPAVSTTYPTQDTVHIRWLGEAAAATTADEVDVDLRPTTDFTVDLSRMHVIGHDDRTITVYYRVYSEDDGWDGTAVFAFSADDVTDIVVAPRLLLNGYVPVVSNAAALRHPVTSEILLALEAADADPGQAIYWYASSGRGTTLDTLPLEWSATTHPHLFGGRWKSAAPDSVINICGMGWSDNKAGGGFRVFAQHVIATVSAVYRDVVNTYSPSTSNHGTARRALVGDIAIVPVAGEACAAGSFEWLGGAAAPMLLSDRDRRGYDLELDPMSAVLVVPLNDVDVSEAVAITVGDAEGVPGAIATRLSPAPGAMRGSLSFTDDASAVQFDGEYYSPEVTVSLWVYPRAAAVPGMRVIASRVAGASCTWGFFWDDAAGNFSVEYTTIADGPLAFASDATIAPLPVDRWYYLTFTYDGTTARLYVNGVLMGVDVAPMGGDLFYNLTDDPVLIGANGLSDSAIARVEELVVGTTPLTHDQVLFNFAHSLSSRTGPVVSSHLADTPDRVVACLIATDDLGTAVDEAGPTYTLSLRDTNITTGIPTFENFAVIDVWRRQRGEAPVYVGCLPTPGQVNDYVNGVAGATDGYGTNPVFAHDSARWQGKAFRTTRGVRFTFCIATGSQDDVHVLDYVFDPEDLYGSFSIEHVGTLTSASGQVPMYGSDVLYDAGSDELLHFLVRGTPDGTTQRLYFVRDADYGVDPWSTASEISVVDMLPAPTETHEGVTWGADFGDGVTGDVRIDGLVVRLVEEGMGLDPSLLDSYQVIFGVSSPGTGTTAVTNLVATCSCVIDGADVIAGGVTATLLAQGVQIDEYGRGGVEPFSPIRWLPHRDPSGDTLLLAATGLRPHDGDGLGDGGLDVYALKREGTWGIRPVCSIPFAHTVPGAPRRGADVAFSIDAAYDYEYTLAVARPYPSAAEQVSTCVLSDLELADGGYVFGAAAALNAMIRTAEFRTTAVWTDHVVQTRHFTDAVTGGTVHRGSRYQAVPFLRWSAPGRPYPIDAASYDSTDFHDQVHPALQGGCYSPGARLTRFWTVNGNDLTPAAGNKQFRLPGSGNYLRSGLVNLGNVRPAYGGTRVAPIGIVDDAVNEIGRYIFVSYEVDDVTVDLVRSYDSPFVNELDNAIAVVSLWTSPPGGVDPHNMRVVVVDDVLYLYYVLGTVLYYTPLPGTGAGAIATAGIQIVDLDVTVDGRMYVVPQPEGRVTLYFGDDDTAGVRRTLALVHAPVAGEVVRELATVYTGAAPFPAAYAACRGVERDNIDHTVVMLEPSASIDGGARHPDPGYLLGEDTGSSWLCASFTVDGYYLVDQMVIDDIVPWRDAAHAAGQGGRARVRTWPTYLERVVDDVATEDRSTEYVLHAAAKMLGREASSPALTKFRHDFAPAAGERANDIGGSILMASFDADPLGLSGATEEKPLYPMLVPGSLHLEPIGGLMFDGLPYAATQAPANPLDGWALDDASAVTGGGGTPNVTQDQVHGVKAAAPSPGLLFLAGWYVVGEPS